MIDVAAIECALAEDRDNPFGRDHDYYGEVPLLSLEDRALAPRGREKPIDWELVALGLASGRGVMAVARDVGCARQTIWRALKRSRALRLRVQQERMALAAEAEARFASLREAAVTALGNGVVAGNARIVIWVAERLGIGAPDLRRDAPDEPRPMEEKKLGEAYIEAVERFARTIEADLAREDDEDGDEPEGDEARGGAEIAEERRQDPSSPASGGMGAPASTPAHPPEGTVARGCASAAAAYDLPAVTAPEERGLWAGPETLGPLALEPDVEAGLGDPDWDRAGALMRTLRTSVARGCMGGHAPLPPVPDGPQGRAGTHARGPVDLIRISDATNYPIRFRTREDARQAVEDAYESFRSMVEVTGIEPS
jgi:hypothetical protein